MFENTQDNNLQAVARTNGKSRRGFASMDKEKHKQISSKGGKAERSKTGIPERNPTAYAPQDTDRMR